MKAKLKFFLSILCLTLSGLALGQNQETENITAIKLTATVGQQYFTKVKTEAFTVDKNNILRPAKGYKIAYYTAEKKIAVFPKTMKLTTNQLSAPGYDTSEVPGGTMFCLCDQANDDCEISPRVLGKTLVYSCNGGCGCGSFIIYDTSDPVLGYETAGGSWTNF